MEKTRLLETQKETEEAIAIMRDNANALIARDEKLEELEKRSCNIKEDAAMFKKNATGIARKMWWKNKKMCVILWVVVVVIIAAVVVWFAAIK
ncbi:synaptobrevin-1-like isoform X2 [Xenia sp. Carnegie-2017]|uniref:synaptobrevin-1-like isoform X1 n=1 Tax=Xenia sp. Carnegie-2017 TaxID=2897299 RepID=UPI001F040355|nr:synaptobrevin-1-like isoform X1 [Xenia sp. Carnegie-2017]XP_046851499.1 synaptobrevin-1-like isoform X2 [Xenia sp. Carnegie-2017]